MNSIFAIGSEFILVFLATMITDQIKRYRFAVVSGLFALIYGLSAILSRDLVVQIPRVMYFVSLGFVLPHLVGRFYVQLQLTSPLEYLPHRLDYRTAIGLLPMIGIIVFYVFIATQPDRVSYITGEGTYSDKNIPFKMSFVITMVLLGLLLLYLPFQRTAFCANGLLIFGVFWAWSNFQSYQWENEGLYDKLDPQMLPEDATIMLTLTTKPGLFRYPKRYRFFFPVAQKEKIEAILRPGFS